MSDRRQPAWGAWLLGLHRYWRRAQSFVRLAVAIPAARCACLGLALLAFAAAPASAETLFVANDYIPPQGQFRLREYLNFRPANRLRSDSQLQALPADAARTWLDATTMLEFGFSDGTGFLFQLPLTYWAVQDGRERVLAFNDLRIAIEQRILGDEDYGDTGVTLMIGGTVPLGDVNRAIGDGASAFNFQANLRQQLDEYNKFRFLANVGLSFIFARQQQLTPTTLGPEIRRGLRIYYNAALEFQAMDALTVAAEFLGTMNGQDTIGGNTVNTSGNNTILFAPSAHYWLLDTLAVRAALIYPLSRSGFADFDYPLAATVGMLVDF